jgi:hypothetical protein
MQGMVEMAGVTGHRGLGCRYEHASSLKGLRLGCSSLFSRKLYDMIQ